MAAPVLVVHSSGSQGPGQGSSPFAERLRVELGSGYEVVFPLMPEPDDPHFAPWSERLGQLLDGFDDPPVVVGHSLGGSVALKHLAEGGREPIAGLVLVATPFWGNEREWELEWALPDHWPDSRTSLPPTHLFHSRDDEEAAFDHLDRYARRLPGATVHPLDGNGHLYDRGDLSEIVDVIRALAG